MSTLLKSGLGGLIGLTVGVFLAEWLEVANDGAYYAVVGLAIAIGGVIGRLAFGAKPD
ncbi:MAG: hypothetical protein WD969_13505 [Paracoccaceae bacterium]